MRITRENQSILKRIQQEISGRGFRAVVKRAVLGKDGGKPRKSIRKMKECLDRPENLGPIFLSKEMNHHFPTINFLSGYSFSFQGYTLWLCS